MAKSKTKRQVQPPVPITSHDTLSQNNRFPKPKVEKPDESWLHILIKAFKHDYQKTLTYKEAELFAWICEEYPYYATQSPEFWHTSVKKTLNNYECFRNVGRNVWTYIDQKATEILKREQEDQTEYEKEGVDFEEEEEEMLVYEKRSTKTKASKTSQRKPSKKKSSRSQKFSKAKERASRKRLSEFMDLDQSDVHTPSPSSSPSGVEKEMNDDMESVHESDNQIIDEGVKVDSPGQVEQVVPSGTNSNNDGNIKYSRMTPEGWLRLLTDIFKVTRKQKTIRELVTLVKDQYPVFRKAPTVWEYDLAVVLESSPEFKNMGRGRWFLTTEEEENQSQDTRMEYFEDVQGTSSTEEEDWRSLGPQKLISSKRRRHSVAGPVRRNSNSTKRKSRKKTNSISYQPSEAPNMSAFVPKTFTSPMPQKIGDAPMTPITPNPSRYQIDHNSNHELALLNTSELHSPTTPSSSRHYEFITETIHPPISPTPSIGSKSKPFQKISGSSPPTFLEPQQTPDFQMRLLTSLKDDHHSNDKFDANLYHNYYHESLASLAQYHLPSSQPHSQSQRQSSHPPLTPSLQREIDSATSPSIQIPDERAAIEALALLCRTEASPL